MPLIPDTPRARAVAIACLVVAAGAAAWRLAAAFSHRHAPLLLYDLERKVLAEYPQGTEPGTGGTAALKLFAKEPALGQPKAGMTLEDLKNAGLHPGWLFRLDANGQIGLYADPGRPDQWLRSDAPECQAQYKRWMDEAAAFSSTGKPIPCNN